MSSCVCKISFKSVQVCGGCCKMFRGLTFLGHSVELITASLYTKFEMSSFIRFKDMTGPKKIEIGHAHLGDV